MRELQPRSYASAARRDRADREGPGGQRPAPCGLLDRRGKYLLPGAGWGLSETYTRKGPVALEKSQVDREAISGNAIFIDDAQTDPRFQYRDAAKAEGIVSVLVVPLMVEGKGVGAMRVLLRGRPDLGRTGTGVRPGHCRPLGHGH